MYIVYLLPQESQRFLVTLPPLYLHFPTQTTKVFQKLARAQQRAQTLDEVIDTVLRTSEFLRKRLRFRPHASAELICSPAGGVNNDTTLKRGKKSDRFCIGCSGECLRKKNVR